MFLCLILCLIALLFGCSSAYKLTFSQSEYVIYVGDSFTPDVTVRPKKIGYDLISSNTTVLTTDGNTIFGQKSGVTTITAVSGDKIATATVYILEKSDIDISDVRFEDTGTCLFYIVNYQSLGLESDLLRTLTAIEKTDITESFPVLAGYSIRWFYDKDGTAPVPEVVLSQKGTTRFYGFASELENSFLLDSEYRIKGLLYPKLSHKVLVFPASYNNREIKGIADNAFFGDVAIEKIIIPSGYETIGKFAFAGCVNLAEVEITDIENSRLTEIGAYAFAPTYDDGNEETDESQTEYGDYEDILGDLNISDILAQLLGIKDIGGNKPSETKPEIKMNDDSCEKLARFDLPDSVSKIGPYAFYLCENFALKKLPTSLKDIEYGVFLGTKTEKVDLTNVETIAAYAFYDCADLSEVTHANKVLSCGGYAFSGTALFARQEKTGVVFADTMLVGCSDSLATLVGNGKIDLNTDITLIADYALNSKNTNELTVYFPQNNVVKIGWSAFYVTGYEGDNSQFPLFSDALFLVVPEDKIAAYRAENPRLYERFCTKTVINISDENAVNFGKHTLLKMTPAKESAYYVYDYFTVGKTSGGLILSPEEIDLARLPVGGKIKRVNTCAIGKVARMTTLRLSTVEQIGSFAVSNCNKLSLIDLTNTQKVTLESRDSIQFSTLAHTGYGSDGYHCYLQVAPSSYEQFYLAWTNESRTTARNQLRYTHTLSLVIVNSAECGLPETTPLSFLTNGSLSIPFEKDGFSFIWYADSSCSVALKGKISDYSTLYGIAYTD